VICKYCKIERQRIFLKKDCRGAKKYVDEKGRHWNALRCPDCQAYNLKKLKYKKKNKNPRIRPSQAKDVWPPEDFNDL